MGTIKLHKCMLQQNKENRELLKLTQEEYNDLLYSRWFSYKGQATYAVLSYIELTSLYQFHVHSLLIFKFLRIERPLPAAFIQTFDASSVLTRNDATPASNWYDAGATISPPCTDILQESHSPDKVLPVYQPSWYIQSASRFLQPVGHLQNN